MAMLVTSKKQPIEVLESALAQVVPFLLWQGLQALK